jgi:tRNA1(Val) A37 N6-methylase TrmN6
MEYPRAFGLEPKALRMVCPRPGEAPNLVLLEYVRGAGKELRIVPELCVRDESGAYSRELNSIYGR